MAADGVTDGVTDGSRALQDAHAWLAHLRAGGTTPWSEFAPPRGPGAGPDRAAAAAERLPGAQELEALRRLNERGPVSAELAAAVLAATPPGRGSLDLPLVGLPARGYGGAPVDPSQLGADELLRVLTGVLADRLVASSTGSEDDDHPPRAWHALREAASMRLPRRHPFRIVGPTLRVDPVRERLAALGRTPGGRGAVHLVLGADMGRLVTDAWTSRVVEGAAPRWSEWLQTWVERDACPPRADLRGIADAWAAVVGTERVAVVLDVAEVAGPLGLGEPVRADPAPPAAAVELTRRVSAVLAVLVDRPRRTRLLGHLLLGELAGAAGPRLLVPDGHEGWLRARGRALESAIDDGGYRVLGSTGLLREPPGPAPGAEYTAEPDDGRVLDLALDHLCGLTSGSAGVSAGDGRATHGGPTDQEARR